MTRFTARDFIIAIVTGLTAGLIGWLMLEYLGRPAPFDLSWAWLMLAIPLLWILGVNLGYFLGQRIRFFHQFGKFVVIGFTNFAVDVGIFNLLFAFANLNPAWFIPCKVFSFAIAACHSYLWNKYWAFNAGSSRAGGAEFYKFAAVSLLALLINVLVAKSVAAAIPPGFEVKVWTNVGLVAGAAAALVFSFTGFKILVFKGR